MPINADRIERMQEYGLTEYEARTYLALQDLRLATARDIANLSRVPRTKIYSVLDDLHQKQLAKIIPERPKKYEVASFDRYLDGFEARYREKLKQVKRDKEVLATPPDAAANGLGEKAGSFNVLKGRKNVMNRASEMISRATANILEMGTEFSVVRMGYTLPALEERAMDDAVRVRLLCPVTARNAENVEALRAFGEVRHHPDKHPGSVLLVIDDAEVLISHYVPDDAHLFKGEDVAIWSDDAAIVRDMKHTILTHWEQARPTGEILEQVLEQEA